MASHPDLTRVRLDEISPSMCLAKWTQVTLHLQNGHNHSCHHPGTHRADLAEIAADPSALHNTTFKKARRQQMLDGTKPAECEFCWAVERSNPDALSDRILKSGMSWSEPYFADVLRAGASGNFTPPYVEVSFSNVCNFKCSYCAPYISSKWMEEIKQYGGYPTSSKFNDLDHIQQSGLMPIPEREANPYVEAFWKWWPALYPRLTDFRITGGEPLLSKHTMSVLEHIRDNPNPKLRLSVNSNLCVPPALYLRFLELVMEIIQRNAVHSFQLYTSVDSYGEQAEYIRNGLNYQDWSTNLESFFDNVPDSRVTIMSTFNALSPFQYLKMFGDLMRYRVKYNRILVDMPHLVHPEHQNMWVLPDSCRETVAQVRAGIESCGLALPSEKSKIGRIADLFQTRQWDDERLLRNRIDFGRFFSEHDRRRGTNFRSVFPESEEFFDHCLELDRHE